MGAENLCFLFVSYKPPRPNTAPMNVVMTPPCRKVRLDDFTLGGFHSGTTKSDAVMTPSYSGGGGGWSA